MQPQIVCMSNTDASAEELRFAHRFLFKRTGYTKEEWTQMMFENGRHYAIVFSGLFGEKSAWMSEYLLRTIADTGDKNNFYWTWWRWRWMQNDYVYINNKVYEQPISYLHFKSFMLHDESIEYDLLDILEQKNTKPGTGY